MNLPIYIQKCEVCLETKHEDIVPMLNKYELELLLHSIYYGDFSSVNLPTSLYLKTAKELQDYLLKGFGVVQNDMQQLKFDKMRRNIYYFSAAKTYMLIKEIEQKREDKSFDTFKGNVINIATDFIGAYLFAEKDHVKQCAKAGKKWEQFSEKKTPPFLEYVTMKDNRVRPAHVYLDGITKQKDDNFWNTFMPPNGWMCRCKVKSYSTGEATDLKDFDMDEALKNVPVMFRENFGKNGIIFPSDHPYFKNADKVLAKNNFNLPLPHFGK